MSDKRQPTPSFTILEVAQKHAIEWEGICRYKGVPFLKKHASPSFLAKDINDVTHKDFQGEMDRYRLGRSAHHNGNRLQEEFNSLMKFAVKHGYRTTPYQSFGHVRRVSQAHMVLSEEERDLLLLEVDRTFREDLKIRIAVRAMALLGLSVAEAAQFDLRKIDKERWKYIQSDAGGRMRYIPIPSPMRPLLKHLEDRSEQTPDASKPWFDLRALQLLVRRIGTLCGLPELMPAILTRTAINGVRQG